MDLARIQIDNVGFMRLGAAMRISIVAALTALVSFATQGCSSDDRASDFAPVGVLLDYTHEKGNWNCGMCCQDVVCGETVLWLMLGQLQSC